MKLAVLAALLALSPAVSLAHEVRHEVERGRAVAVRAWFADGEILTSARYEVYSPADPKVPHQKGRTDRNGWLAFVPDASGAWRVRVFDETGHGLDVRVEAAPAVPAATAAPAVSPSAAAAPAAAGADTAPPAPSTATVVLRPLAGIGLIAAMFGALFVLYRRKGTTR
jgi:nickel transport protein